GEEAGENLTHEACTGHRAQGDGGFRIPQIVDAEWHLEAWFHGFDDACKSGDRFDRRLVDIRTIVLIAEHDGIDAARLQAFDIAGHIIVKLGDAATRILKLYVWMGST